MRLLFVCLVLFCVVLPQHALAQADLSATFPVGNYTFPVHFLRTNFELNIPYTSPIITMTPPCPFDDWDKTINWGDGQVETPSHKDDSGTLYSSHQYVKVGTYTATLSISFHCKGYSGGKVLVAVPPVQIGVFGRIPVFDISVSSSSVKGGDPITGTVTLAGYAPPSGTRVAIESGELAGGPTEVIVPPNETAAPFTLTTQKVVQATIIRLKAKTISKYQVVEVTLTP
jgi:hypothetical protein